MTIFKLRKFLAVEIRCKNILKFGYYQIPAIKCYKSKVIENKRFTRSWYWMFLVIYTRLDTVIVFVNNGTKLIE